MIFLRLSSAKLYGTAIQLFSLICRFIKQLKSMLSIYNFLKVKLCYRTYWKQWIAFILITIILYLWAELGVGIFFQDSWGGY